MRASGERPEVAAAEDNTPLIEHILELGERLFLTLAPNVTREWFSLDLTTSQLKVIMLLFTDGPARIGVLASSLDMPLSVMTGIADRLVERGMLVRESDPSDRRVTICKLSESSKGLMRRLTGLELAKVAKGLSGMPPQELRLITQAMEAILRDAEAAGSGWRGEEARDRE